MPACQGSVGGTVRCCVRRDAHLAVGGFSVVNMIRPAPSLAPLPAKRQLCLTHCPVPVGSTTTARRHGRGSSRARACSKTTFSWRTSISCCCRAMKTGAPPRRASLRCQWHRQPLPWALCRVSATLSPPLLKPRAMVKPLRANNLFFYRSQQLPPNNQRETDRSEGGREGGGCIHTHRERHTHICHCVEPTPAVVATLAPHRAGCRAGRRRLSTTRCTRSSSAWCTRC